MEQCFQQTDDGSWYNPGFGDHHLSVSRTDKVVSRTDKVVSRTDKSVGWEGVLSSEINAPSPQEQNREEQEHTHKSMCGNGKDKQEEPTPDSGDDDPEIMEIFRALADPPSRYRSLSPDGDPTNGHGPNGHNRTSPTTDDLDHAVETYLAAYPMTTGKPDLVRQELAKVPFDQVMAGLSYHKSYIWRTKGDRWIPDPENFLINGTWKKGRRPGSPAGLLQDTTRRMGNDDGCDDGSDRACG